MSRKRRAVAIVDVDRIAKSARRLGVAELLVPFLLLQSRYEFNTGLAAARCSASLGPPFPSHRRARNIRTLRAHFASPLCERDVDPQTARRSVSARRLPSPPPIR